MSTKKWDKIRKRANDGIVIGQIILLYGHMHVGIIIKVASSLLILKSMYDHKMNDMVRTLVFFNVVDLSRLLYFLITGN